MNLLRAYCPDIDKAERRTLAVLIYVGLIVFSGLAPQDQLGCFAQSHKSSSGAKHSKLASSVAKTAKRQATAKGGVTPGRRSRGIGSANIRHGGRSVVSNRGFVLGRKTRVNLTTNHDRSRSGSHRIRSTVSTVSARHHRISKSGRYHRDSRAISPDKTSQATDQDDNQAEAQAAVEAQPRLRNYALLGNAYALYDQGVNERLKGNYGLSTDKLSEAAKLIDQASSIGRDGRPSTLAAMVFFELGQSAEADGDQGLARDSYVHAVRAKAGYVEAYLRLVNVLATGGKVPQALNWLKDGLRESPHDPRLNAMLVHLAGFMGDSRNSGDGTDMSIELQCRPDHANDPNKTDGVDKFCLPGKQKTEEKPALAPDQ